MGHPGQKKKPVFKRKRAFSSIPLGLAHRASRVHAAPSLAACHPYLHAGARPAGRDGSGELLPASDERANPFGEERHVEGLAERLVEDRAVEPARVVFVAQEAHEDRFDVFRVLAEVLGDHDGFVAAHHEVDHDAIGMQRFGLNTSFESAVGEIELEGVAAHLVFQSIANAGFGADDKDLADRFVFQFAQGHPVFLEEPDEVLTGNAAILGTGDAITAQAARVEPLAHRAGGYFTDLSYLSSSKDRFHGRLSRLFCQTEQKDADPLKPHSYHVGRRSLPSDPLGEPPWSWIEASLGFRKTAVGLSPQRSVAIRWR